MSDERNAKNKASDERNEPDVEAHKLPKVADEADDDTPDVVAHKLPKMLSK